MKARKLHELTAYRKRENLTRAELATRLRVSRVTVWRWEEGKQFPDDEYVPMLAGLLGVSEPVLLGFSEAA
jgi:transcriptional regulator with XRE-family HTH domain